MIQSYWGPGLTAHEAYEAESERRYYESQESYCAETRSLVITWGHGEDWDIDRSERFLRECKELLYGECPKFVFDPSKSDGCYAETSGIDDRSLARCIDDAVDRILLGETTGEYERESIINGY